MRLFYITYHQTGVIISIGFTAHITMDKEPIVVKTEPEMFVVVKEETVDLTEESGYESSISCDIDYPASKPWDLHLIKLPVM